MLAKPKSSLRCPSPTGGRPPAKKARSIHPSRKMTGLVLSIACNAPSENRPSGKDAEGDGKFNVQMAYDEVDRRLFGNAAPDRLVGRFAKRKRERGPDRLRQRRFEDGELFARSTRASAFIKIVRLDFRCSATNSW